MSILDLSYELILLITDYLTEPHDIYALLQTHRGIAQFLAPVLSKFTLQDKYSTAALFCYAAHGNASKVHTQLSVLCKPWQLPPTPGDVTDAITAGANYSFDVGLGRARSQRALHWAVINNKPAMISFLLSKGADIEFRDPNTGAKAIDHAIVQGNSRLVRLLVGKGADVGAWEPNCGGLLHCVIECMRKVPVSRRAVLEPEFKAILITLLNNGADIDKRDKYLQTALHLAVLCWTGVVEVLLRAGADVNARDCNDNTPLHMAALNPPSDSIIEVLLRNGADPMLRNADNRAPICLQGLATSAEAKQLLLDARGAHVCGKKCGTTQRQISEYDLRIITFRYPWATQWGELFNPRISGPHVACGLVLPNRGRGL